MKPGLSGPGFFRYGGVLVQTRSNKRQKELARQEKQRAKEERREARRREKELRPARTEDGEDPDIAGIVPGPQPKPEEEEQG
jgi:hypothetical protein